MYIKGTFLVLSDVWPALWILVIARSLSPSPVIYNVCISTQLICTCILWVYIYTCICDRIWENQTFSHFFQKWAFVIKFTIHFCIQWWLKCLDWTFHCGDTSKNAHQFYMSSFWEKSIFIIFNVHVWCIIFKYPTAVPLNKNNDIITGVKHVSNVWEIVTLQIWRKLLDWRLSK